MTRYLTLVAAFYLAVFIHVILFNLHVADLGFREDAMGQFGAAMTAGTLLAALPAAWLARRWGLKRVILAASLGLAVALAARASVSSYPALLASSVILGICTSAFNVANPPAIAVLAPAKYRAQAFSGNIALAMGIGAVGGLLAGWLPSLLHSKLATLLLAAALPLAGLAAVTTLRLDAAIPGAAPQPQSEPSRRFLLRFVAGVGLWYAFTAGFMPFFNVYMSRVHQASIPAIGGTFAASQVVQALAVLSMGWWIARLGLTRSVLLVQLLASLAVLAFLPVETLAAAGLAYMLYVSLLFMPEPALQNLLMDRVAAADRPKASAINQMLNLGTNMIVVAAAGSVISRAGYQTLFLALTVLGLVSTAAFYAVLGRLARRVDAKAP
jgi:predicted MFS family arabinose efflux permease